MQWGKGQVLCSTVGMQLLYFSHFSPIKNSAWTQVKHYRVGNWRLHIVLEYSI